MARFKDLTCAIVDVGADSHNCVAAWVNGLETSLSKKVFLGPHQELAVIAFGSGHTNHDLTGAEYDGINLLTPFQPGSAATLKKIEANVVPSKGPTDCFSALIVALDLLVRTVDERKLHQARKSIVIASSFLTVADPLDADSLKNLAAQSVNLKVNVDVVVGDWTPLSRTQQAARAQTLNAFSQLHAAGAAGRIIHLEHPADFSGVLKAQASFISTACILKVHQFEYEVKTYKMTDFVKTPSAKPYSTKLGPTAAPGSASTSQTGPATHDVRRDTEWYLKSDSDRTNKIELEERVKAYRFGKEWFPALSDDQQYKWRHASPAAAFKGIQVISFINREPTRAEYDQMDEDADAEAVPVPRWALQDTISVLMPCTEKVSASISALAQALHAKKRIALVRYSLRSNSAINLGVLIPVICGPGNTDAITGGLSSAQCPDHFILAKVPWAGEYRSVLVDAESAADRAKVSDEHAESMAQFVEEMTDSSASLRSDKCADPVTARLALEVIRSGMAQQDGSTKPHVVQPFTSDPIAQRVLFPDSKMTDARKAVVARVVAAYGIVPEAVVKASDLEPVKMEDS